MAVLLTANSTGISKGVKRGQRDLVGLGGTAKAVTASVAKVGAAIGVVATAGMALRGTLKVGANFESVMSELAARTRASGVEFDQLKAKAEQLGRATIFDNDQAGKAMIELSKAGFSTEQILGSVGNVLSLATAESIELADAAAMTAGALKKFELDASQAGRVTDVLAAGAGSALTDISTLSDQLAFAAGPARNAGKSIEETVAAIGALSDKVDKGIAGTGLQQIFAKMAKPTAQAQKQLDKLGLSFTDNQGNFKDLATVVDEFNAALGSLNPEERARALNTIFESRSGNAFSGLLSAGGDDLRSRLAALQEASGRTGEMADTMQDNVSGGFKSVMSAVKGFATDVFQLFEGPLKNALFGLADFINGPFLSAFERLVGIGGQALEALVEPVATLGRWLDPAVGWVNELVFGFSDLSDEGITFGAVFDEVLTAVEVFFDTFETRVDLAGAWLALAGETWVNDLSFVFTDTLPSAIDYMVTYLQNKLQDAQFATADFLLSLPGADTIFGADADAARAELASMQNMQRAQLPTVKLDRGSTPMEKALKAERDRLQNKLNADSQGFREQRDRDARNREMTRDFEKAGRDAWAAMMGDGSATKGTGLQIDPVGESQSVINDGIKATEKLAGPELAARGSRAAYDAIYRAIQGNRDRGWQNDSLDALQQIANNTAQQPSDEVVNF